MLSPSPIPNAQGDEKRSCESHCPKSMSPMLETRSVPPVHGRQDIPILPGVPESHSSLRLGHQPSSSSPHGRYHAQDYESTLVASRSVSSPLLGLSPIVSRQDLFSHWPGRLNSVPGWPGTHPSLAQRVQAQQGIVSSSPSGTTAFETHRNDCFSLPGFPSLNESSSFHSPAKHPLMVLDSSRQCKSHLDQAAGVN